MLRSLFAIIAAVIAGLAAAKFIELAGQAVLSTSADALSPAYQTLLTLGWGVGAFAAALTALLIGRRWAPLGWLAAASICFAACITVMTFTLSWVLWPASAAATGIGGFLAVRLLNASYALPATGGEKEIFSD